MGRDVFMPRQFLAVFLYMCTCMYGEYGSGILPKTSMILRHRDKKSYDAYDLIYTHISDMRYTRMDALIQKLPAGKSTPQVY